MLENESNFSAIQQHSFNEFHRKPGEGVKTFRPTIVQMFKQQCFVIINGYFMMPSPVTTASIKVIAALNSNCTFVPLLLLSSSW